LRRDQWFVPATRKQLVEANHSFYGVRINPSNLLAIRGVRFTLGEGLV
jgi:hypothetical protein